MSAELPVRAGVEFRRIARFQQYCVGDDGSIWSSRSGEWREMRATQVAYGYLVVSLRDEGQKKFQFYVHRLVLESFVGVRSEGMVARHFPDRNPANNKLGNLQWGTYQENSDDMSIHGTVIRGEEIPWSTLTDDIVLSLRNEYATSRVTVQQLSDKYSIPFGTLVKLLRHVTWKHVGGPRPRDRVSRDVSNTNRGLRRFRERTATGTTNV